MGSLGDRLARVRGFRRMSQQELAVRTGLKVQNISRLETDQREHVRSDTLRRLAEALPEALYSALLRRGCDESGLS